MLFRGSDKAFPLELIVFSISQHVIPKYGLDQNDTIPA